MRPPSELWGAALRRLRSGARQALSRIDGSGRDLPDLLFIFGCQRSGTSMMQDVFDRDLRCQVFRDVSPLSRRGGAEGIRLDPLDEVEAQLRSTRTARAVAKPLADSHRVGEILDRFPEARALWIYRDVLDVAASDMRYFSTDNGIRNLTPMAERDPDNWRSAGLSEAVAAEILSRYSTDMDPRDAAALFWFARNALFFEQGLDHHPRVRLVRYAHFVSAPVQEIQNLYGWLGWPVPSARLVSDVHTGSVGKASGLVLSPDVGELCQMLLERFDYLVRSGREDEGDSPPEGQL